MRLKQTGSTFVNIPADLPFFKTFPTIGLEPGKENTLVLVVMIVIFSKFPFSQTFRTQYLCMMVTELL